MEKLELLESQKIFHKCSYKYITTYCVVISYSRSKKVLLVNQKTQRSLRERQWTSN